MIPRYIVLEEKWDMAFTYWKPTLFCYKDEAASYALMRKGKGHTVRLFGLNPEYEFSFKLEVVA